MLTGWCFWCAGTAALDRTCSVCVSWLDLTDYLFGYFEANLIDSAGYLKLREQQLIAVLVGGVSDSDYLQI